MFDTRIMLPKMKNILIILGYTCNTFQALFF